MSLTVNRRQESVCVCVQCSLWFLHITVDKAVFARDYWFLCCYIFVLCCTFPEPVSLTSHHCGSVGFFQGFLDRLKVVKCFGLVFNLQRQTHSKGGPIHLWGGCDMTQNPTAVLCIASSEVCEALTPHSCSYVEPHIYNIFGGDVFKTSATEICEK